MTILLLSVATFLTFSMFHTKSMMLGFPCVIFWAISGGNAYLISTATWDVYYLVFFASMGMAIFSAFAMYGLREKRDTIGDKSMENESESFIDEVKEPVIQEPEEYKEPKDLTARDRLRQRAEARRTTAGRKEVSNNGWRKLK